MQLSDRPREWNVLSTYLLVRASWEQAVLVQAASAVFQIDRSLNAGTLRSGFGPTFQV
jgi:hypothetical protein